MPRTPRIEYEGAVYHVMSRGNAGAEVFTTDADRELFMRTLREACARCGWRVHAFVLMGNHYHLLLETPEANLVAGMKWLQGTFTQRLNRRKQRRGHLFQGRYKALVVDGSQPGYFSTVAGYIHLNPARARILCASGSLADYAWSSFPLYTAERRDRPDWLCVDRVLGDFQLRDDPKGRARYAEYLQNRVADMTRSDDPGNHDPQWKNIRRGWFLGDQAFKESLLEKLEGVMSCNLRQSYSGQGALGHDMAEAERLTLLGMNTLALKQESLETLKKNCPEKYAIAWLVRRNTCVKNQWIKDRLRMGKATNFSSFLSKMEAGEFGSAEFELVKNIKS